MSIPPSGITPAASFELAGFEPQLEPPVILSDMIDPRTGEYESLVATRTIADGMVIFLMGLQRRSGAAVLQFGHRLREITHADGEAPEGIERECRDALQPAVDTGTIRFERVDALQNEDDRTQIDSVVRYVDLLAPRSQREKTRTFNP